MAAGDDESREQRDQFRDREALGERLTADQEQTCRIVENNNPVAAREQETWHSLAYLLEGERDDLSTEDASRLVEHSLIEAASLGPRRADELATRPLGADKPARDDEVPTFEAGDRFERYTVLDRIGEGGMGIVYSAYDPQLDRKVALKVLRQRVGESSGASSAPVRLIREAQAMARLSHPNVTQVYEADTFDGKSYIAFEYVQGKTLRAWLKDGSRRWSHVLPPFLAAGRGLRAAHAAGLVHRDFKPTNVLVGDDGQVRVTDFGLARLEASEPPSPSGTSGAAAHTSSQSLTTVGTVLGTPRYMAPEQLRGEEVDERADQFSFCVALWEALYGKHPYTGRKDEALADAFDRGSLQYPTAKADVPRWLRRTLARGLAIEPSQRWPTMADLLLRLDRSPRRAWRWVVAASLFLAVGASFYVVVQQREAAARICSGGAEKVAQVWNDERRNAGRGAFAATNVPLAEDLWSRTEARIDAYTRAWGDTYRESCEATQVRHEQSEAAMDLRIACLGRQLGELKALLDVLGHPDQDTVFNAIAVTTELPPVERCNDLEALRARVPAPDDAEVARRVDELSGQAARARALHAAGRYKEGRELAQAAVMEARTIGYEPVLVQTLIPLGMLSNALGDYDRSEQQLTEAALTADATRQDRLAAEAKVRVIDLLARQPERTDDAIQWAKQARAAIQRAGETGGALEARLLAELAGIYDTKAESERAIELAQQAVDIYERTLGPKDPHLTHALLTLGNASTWKDAERHYQRAIEISREVFGPDHPTVAAGVHNLAIVFYDRGEWDRSREHFERALAAWEGVLGPDHPNVATALANYGSMLCDAGRFDEARPILERAQVAFESTLGPKDVMVGHTLDAIGLLSRREGKYAEARREYSAALEILERVYGLDHPLLAPTLRGQGEILLAEGKPGQALDPLERAFALASKSQEELDRADASFSLAKALWDAKRDRVRAVGLSEDARKIYARHLPGAQARLDRIRGWLDER